ncbi:MULTISPECIES: GNAT family N-acetyltransferase [unclassified Streptomyces]|uniref:GNAT family N-acetyltransferase n=1 Tax=unclassified Streptomyces TaxID=2593676 RepID=UPI001BE77197|nr:MULTISPECIES: GNAT family N-acetyltransferase [unclassified Streptomyces]MBT2403645.1 GNAT family N-acetyltransferase [Streptomyces sp. ISL-21]MBT2609816.1 GNAT family N-acetyltransferase [Streptomyces sp. ISL-87]
MIIDDGMLFRQAEEKDAGTLVKLYDQAARWMRANGIDQWKPGEKDVAHFRKKMRDGEVWLAEDADGRVVGGYELWWSDEEAWGIQPPVAGYVHRLMVERSAAPAGAGRRILEHAERRIARTGRERARLDCVSTNPRLLAYYQGAGYRVVGEFPSKQAKDGRVYGVILLERLLDC